MANIVQDAIKQFNQKRMLLSPQIVQCDNCMSLKDMLEKIDCSLFHLAKNRWNNEAFNVSLYTNMQRFKDLTTYRRIIHERVYNPCYMGRHIDSQDILAKAGRLLYGDGECSKCVSCSDNTTTTTTTSTSTTTTTTIIS